MRNPTWRWGLPLLPSSEQKSLQTSRPHEGLGEGRVVTRQPQSSVIGRVQELFQSSQRASKLKYVVRMSLKTFVFLIFPTSSKIIFILK